MELFIYLLMHLFNLFADKVGVNSITSYVFFRWLEKEWLNLPRKPSKCEQGRCNRKQWAASAKGDCDFLYDSAGMLALSREGGLSLRTKAERERPCHPGICWVLEGGRLPPRLQVEPTRRRIIPGGGNQHFEKYVKKCCPRQWECKLKNAARIHKHWQVTCKRE